MPARRSVHAPLSTIASISDSSRKNINHGETVYDVPPRTPYRDCSRSAPAICRAVCERISPNRQAKKAVPILPLFQCEKVCNHVIMVIMALQAKWLISRPNRLFFRNQSNQASIVGFIPQLAISRSIHAIISPTTFSCLPCDSATPNGTFHHLFKHPRQQVAVACWATNTG